MRLPPSYEPYTPQQMTEMRAANASVRTIITPRAANIPPDEMRDINKLGPEREGAVDLMAQAGVDNPNAFPPGTFDPQELQNTNDWRKQLDELITETRANLEMLENTRTAVGSRAITLTLTGYALLQSAAKVIAGLKDTVKTIGEALRRKPAPKTKPTP